MTFIKRCLDQIADSSPSTTAGQLWQSHKWESISRAVLRNHPGGGDLPDSHKTADLTLSKFNTKYRKVGEFPVSKASPYLLKLRGRAFYEHRMKQCTSLLRELDTTIFSNKFICFTSCALPKEKRTVKLKNIISVVSITTSCLFQVTDLTTSLEKI